MRYQRLILSIAVIVVALSSPSTSLSQVRKGGKSRPAKNALAQEIEKIEISKRKVADQLLEVTKKLNELKAEELADFIDIVDMAAVSKNKTVDALTKIKALFDIGRASYGSTTSVMNREYWLALSQALEGGVVLLDALFESNPALANSPARVYVEALSAGSTLIAIAEHQLEKHLLEQDRIQLERVATDFDRALTALRQKANQSSSQSFDRKPEEGSNRQPGEIIAEVARKIETVARDPGPIYLDYESGGVRTETPPKELRGIALQKWLEAHQDFLKVVRNRSSLGSNSPNVEPVIPPPAFMAKGKESELSKWLSEHPDFLRRILENNLPPESKNQPIEVSDQEAKNVSEIPPGWVECQCPADHPNLGIFIRMDRVVRQFHDPAFRCPQ